MKSKLAALAAALGLAGGAVVYVVNGDGGVTVAHGLPDGGAVVYDAGAGELPDGGTPYVWCEPAFMFLEPGAECPP